MGAGMHAFSIEDLEKLDENQLAFLRRAIEREVRTNPEIHRILRERFQTMYERMTGPAATQARPRRPRTPRTPRPRT
jgi:L-serine deaminase